MKDIRIIKPYDCKVGKLVFRGKHSFNDLVPEVAFIQDGSDHDEAPYILYGRDHDNYFLETRENLERLESLKEIEAKIEQLKDEATQVIAEMTDPIYAKSYWKHATVDTSDSRTKEVPE